MRVDRLRNMRPPTTFLGAVRYFSSESRCRQIVQAARWPDGQVTCPICGSDRVSYLANAKVWKCYAGHRRAKFSLKSGTVFEHSPLKLQQWLPAIWLFANCGDVVSSYELASAIGATQKSAWFVIARLRRTLRS